MTTKGSDNVQRQRLVFRRTIPLLLLALIAGLLALARPFPALAAGADQEGEIGQPIIISWSTESEVNTAGYNIYRAENEDGPWEKINNRLIPGSPDPLSGGSYVFSDTNVIAGTTYWYELEEVELSGVATRLERTQATAQAAGPRLPTLPCGGALILLPAVGMVLLSRRYRRPAY